MTTAVLVTIMLAVLYVSYRLYRLTADMARLWWVVLDEVQPSNADGGQLTREREH